MGLRFDPIGGGQFKQALKQIIEAESQPIRDLETRKGREEARLKLFQEFKGKFAGLDKSLNEIATFQQFRELKVDLGDGSNLVNVTIDKEKANPGSYTIEVDALAARTSVISNGFEDPNESQLGMGFVVTYDKNGNSKEIFVDEDHSSLNGVAQAINSDPESMVRAAVVKDASEPDGPWKLIMTAKKEGEANQIDFPDFYFLDGEKDFYVDDNRDSQNAQIQIDGFQIEQESNDISNFLPGVNLHLKQARPDQPFTMTINQDVQKISAKVKGLVDQLNQVLQFIYQQNKVDEHSDTRTTFTGDSGLQSIEYRIRNLMHEGFPVGDPESDDFSLMFMNQLGIEFDKTGQLQFKEEKFQKALDSNFDEVAQAITRQDYGFAMQMRQVIDMYTRSNNGLLAMKEQGMRSRIKDIDRQIDTKSQALDRRQQQLVDQFSRLEASLGDLQRQQQYLSATLPGAGGGGNLVQQLLGG